MVHMVFTNNEQKGQQMGILPKPADTPKGIEDGINFKNSLIVALTQLGLLPLQKVVAPDPIEPEPADPTTPEKKEYFVKISGFGNGILEVAPEGWTLEKDASGEYTLTHNLDTNDYFIFGNSTDDDENVLTINKGRNTVDLGILDVEDSGDRSNGEINLYIVQFIMNQDTPQ